MAELARLFLLMARERQPCKTSGQTLADSPGSFYPLGIVSGDKREDSESRITRADFGAVSASPAESRWVLKLGLAGDVEFFGDKVFVLETEEQLRERFGRKHLLVIGSPASNHLARRFLLSQPIRGWRRGAPIFRFNLDQEIIRGIESLVGRLQGLNKKQLVGEKGDPETDKQLKNWLQDLFTGGVVDPSYHDLWLRGRREVGRAGSGRLPRATGKRTTYPTGDGRSTAVQLFVAIAGGYSDNQGNPPRFCAAAVARALSSELCSQPRRMVACVTPGAGGWSWWRRSCRGRRDRKLATVPI